MNLLHEITPGKQVPDVINVIIEIPKGSKNKYELDKETGLITLDRALHTSQDYPFDYGFMPQSHWADGDPLDVVVLTTYPLESGVLVKVRPVGIMHMVDDGESDAKILGVPDHDPRWNDVKELEDINKHTLKEIEHFFLTYKKLQHKEVHIDGIEGRDKAIEAVNKSIQAYKEKFQK
ncbi:MAG: inorganic pyrophosphatase [Patescibacteria group bacterium]|jgi:inorganic pyrophosphatase|nr:inorganic pyrophosphatase [Patescibacteria group bacterium]